MNELVYSDQIASDLRSAMSKGKHGLAVVPGLLRIVLENDRWRKRIVQRTGEMVEFDSFVKFVETTPPEGLGATIDTLKNLCRDDTAVRDAIDRVVQRKVGKRKVANPFIVNNVNDKPEGNSTDAALRRLRKDRPDLHARVLQDEMSPHAAMVEAGFRPRTITVRTDDIHRAAATLSRHFDVDVLVAALTEQGTSMSEG